MTASAYKMGYGRKGQLCAICVDRTRGATTELQLGAGVGVWLCAEHRSEAFQRRRAGRDFTLTLQRIWSASNVLTTRRSAALSAHQARLRPQPARRRPGSYAWPCLRVECERRLAAGEPLRAIEADLRRRHAGNAFSLPSGRTFARWAAEGRWRPSGPMRPQPRPTPPRPPTPTTPPRTTTPSQRPPRPLPAVPTGHGASGATASPMLAAASTPRDVAGTHDRQATGEPRERPPPRRPSTP